MTKDRQNMQHRYIELFYDGSGSGAGGGGRGGGGGGGYSSGKFYLILTLKVSQFRNVLLVSSISSKKRTKTSQSEVS